MKIRYLVSIVSLLVLSLFINNSAFASENYHIFINEEKVSFEEPTYIKEGRILVPIRFITEELESDIIWHPEERKVEIKTKTNDRIWFFVDNNTMLFNDEEYCLDVEPEIQFDRTYLPIRHIAEFLHNDVSWNEKTRTASLKDIPLYTVKKGDTLASIAQSYNISIEELKERNNLKGEALYTGSKLKIVIPNILKEKKVLPKPKTTKPTTKKPSQSTNKTETRQATNTSSEVEHLLARLIHAEAQGEPYSGKLGVANVVLNRVKDNRFPNTIKDVIYQKNQFSPVRNGKINNTPNNDSVRAAKEALAGKNNVPGALYFFNPRVTTSSWFTSKPVVANIGNHRFAK